MISFETILSATAPVFIIVGLGFFMHRRGWLSEEFETKTMWLALNLLVPCLILTVIPGNQALVELSSVFWAAGIGFVTIILGISIAYAFGWLARFKKGTGLRTFALSTGIQNYGYLPIPIITELFSKDSGPMGLVFVHAMGVELAMWSIGLMVLTGRANWRSVVNGPFISVLIALLLNYTGLFRYVPKPVDSAMEMLGQCAVPISVFMIGATMGRYFKRDLFIDAWRVCISSLVVRMILMTSLILLGIYTLPMPPDLKTLMVIQAAMPTAIFPIVLARLYEGSPTVAIQVVLATSLVSVVSSPLVIAFGFRLIS